MGGVELSFSEAVVVLQRGEVILFPTETFWGIGGSCFSETAVNAVYQIKQRGVHFPLPLVAGSLEQAACVADISFLPLDFARSFWPGAVTILLPAKDTVPQRLLGQEKKVAVRVTAHSTLASLCLAVGTPLTASSANKSGQPAVSQRHDLASFLLTETAGVLVEGESPAGALPSSIVEPLGDKKLLLRREGAVPLSAFEALGYTVVSL